MVQQAVIDPEGDFVTLAEKFGHVVVDAARSEGDLQRIAARVRQHRVSVVLNLEGLDTEAQMRCAAAFLGGLFDADRDYWYPMLVVVDEAQLFAPAAAGEVSDEARKISLGAMTNLMCRGRKRGLAGIIATQRLAKLAKNVAAEASNFLMGRTFLDIDMARAADLLGMERRQAEMFRDLERGHFVALGPAMSRRPLPMRIGDVETSARSGTVQADAVARAADVDAARSDLHRRRGRGLPARSRRAAPPPPPAARDQRSPGPARPLPAAAAPEPQAEMTEDRRPSATPCSTRSCARFSGDPKLPSAPWRCCIRISSSAAASAASPASRPTSGLPPPLGGGPRGRRYGDRRRLRMGSCHDLRGGSRGGYPGCLPAARPRRDGGIPCPPDGEIARVLRQPLARSRPSPRRLS